MTCNAKIWVCALFLVGFWACSDDSENVNGDVTQEDVGNVTSIDEGTIAFMDAITLSNEILTDEQVINGRIHQCYVVSSTENDKELLVSFESTCEGVDGKVRSGSFLISWDGAIQSNDFNYTVSFNHHQYKVDGYELGGSLTVSNLNFKENGFSFNAVVNNGVVIRPDGFQHLYEQDLDYDFSYKEIMELRITGSITGTGIAGVTYIASIKEPILVVSGCEFAVSGSFDATFYGRPMINVNYGEGVCDNKAVAKLGEHSLTFELN
jgi:hypothetical protein